MTTMPIEMVIPRSGCSTSSVRITTVTGTTGESAYFQRCMTARRAASTWAPHSVSATFTPSDGWKENVPIANHAFEPLRSTPTASTATSSSTAITSNAGAHERRVRGGTGSASQNSARPGTQNMSCRVNTEYDEPLTV